METDIVVSDELVNLFNEEEEKMEVDSGTADEDKKNGNKRGRENTASNSPLNSPPNKKVQDEPSASLEEECLASEVVEEDTRSEVSKAELQLKVTELKNTIQKLSTDHEKGLVDKQKESDEMNKAMNMLKKENVRMKKEMKQVKDENVKLNQEVGQYQYDKDRHEIKAKSAEKI